MISRSPHPDIDIPDNISLPEFIFQVVEAFADKAALVDAQFGGQYT